LIQPVSKPKTGGRPQGPGKTKPLYRGAKGEGRSEKENPVPSHFHPIAPAHFSLRDDGTIGAVGTRSTASETKGEKVGDDVEIVPTSSELESIWTLTAPGGAEKEHGKHPTQKPVRLIERCLLAATNEGDLVLDPFLGGGTTAVAAVRLKRGCVGVEMDATHFALAARRADRETVLLWLREFRVNVAVAIFFQNDLDPDGRSMDRISGVKDSEPKAECIYHETKFVFLSCAAVSSTSVVHTTVETSLQEAWAKTPTGKKRETTHIVRCQTEILRVKSG
jgi:hypothetical protein